MTKTSDKSEPPRSRDTFAKILTDWRRVLVRCADEAEQFTKEKPAAGLAAAFIVGLFAGSFFRRR